MPPAAPRAMEERALARSKRPDRVQLRLPTRLEEGRPRPSTVRAPHIYPSWQMPAIELTTKRGSQLRVAGLGERPDMRDGRMLIRQNDPCAGNTACADITLFWIEYRLVTGAFG